mmetsp:Transcript_14495/g.25615  ORF Transcript_14495/g.25615 Transcript_14495/m.25615 type:complete len:1129 (-) Transcript_14495:118-3504(-)
MAEVDFETRHKFADCCKNGDFNQAKQFIKDHPVLINCTRPNSRTDFCPIHQGAFMGNLEFVKFLLTSGADPRRVTREGQTALDIAFEKNHTEIVDALENALEKENREGRLARRWGRIINERKGQIDDVYDEMCANPDALKIIPPNEKLAAKIESCADDGTVVTADYHCFPRCMEVVYHKGRGSALMLAGKEVEDGAAFWVNYTTAQHKELLVYNTRENAEAMGMEGQQQVSGGAGSSFQTRQFIHAAYAAIHQLAFYGNSDAMKQLAKDVPKCDWSVRSLHGDSILDIANHKFQKHFAKDARQVMEEQFAAIADEEQRMRIVDILNPPPIVPIRGLLSNLPEGDGYFPARPMQAVTWMADCRKNAKLKDAKGLNEDWLFARIPLKDDPVLKQMVTYFKAALPIHRGPVEALSNFVQGGALLGSSGFPQMARKAEEFTSAEVVLKVVRTALYDMSDRIDALTRSHDVSAANRKIMGGYCENRLAEELLKFDPIRAACGLDPKAYATKADEMKTSLSKSCGGPKGLGRSLLRLFTQLNEEMKILKNRLLEFIAVCEKGVGIAAGSDKALGTNNHIFAMLGSNPGPGGGWDYGPVGFALKKTILYHPDCDVTPNATTEYAGARRMEQIKHRRPWMACGNFPADDSVEPVDRMPKDDQLGWGWGEPVTSLTCDSLVGDPQLNTNKGFFARKRNQLHGYLSSGFEEALAREVVAGARCALTGVRPNYGGRRGPGGCDWIGREPGPRGGLAPLKFNGDWHCTDKLVVGGREVAVGSLKPEECTFDVVLQFYNELEGHGRIEIHLPRCVTREAIEHIFITDDTISKLRDGTDEMKKTFMELRSGLALPDGREIKISDSDTPPWSSLTPATVTVSTSMQNFILAQEQFFRKRYDMFLSCEGKAKSSQTFEQLSMTDGQQRRRGISFRTGSFLNRSADWLPRIDGDMFSRGFAISFESNSTNGILVHFAARPCQPPDAPAGADKDNFAKYHLALGVGYNKATRIGKLGPEEREIVIRNDGYRYCPEKSMAAVSPSGEAIWQRYWVGVSYEGGRAFVVFGWLGPKQNPPDVVNLKPVGDKSIRNEEFTAETRHDSISRPIFSDASPIENIRYVGFATEKVPVTVRGLHIHPAPKVRIH